MHNKISKKIFHLLPLKEEHKNKIRILCGKKPIPVLGHTGKIDIYASPASKMQIENPKKVSVVIPNYNYAKYIIERIDSILFQTYPIYEVIILDDCSTDNSVAVIKEKIEAVKDRYTIHLIQNNKNSGNVFAQWKRAFQVATGDFVWIAEADDSCDCHFLETVMKAFSDPEMVISYCESLTIDGENNLLMGNLRPWIDQFGCGKWDFDYVRDGIDEITETLCINNTIANVSSVVFRNGDYQEIIENAKQFRLAGDWYVYMRILERGKISYNSQSLNYHRMQQQGLTLSTSHEKEFEEIVTLQNYAINHYPVPEEVRKKVLERREKEKVRFGLQ